MIKPSDIHGDPDAKPASDREPEVKPELIQDLDVPAEDAAGIAGGEATGGHGPTKPQ